MKVLKYALLLLVVLALYFFYGKITEDRMCQNLHAIKNNKELAFEVKSWIKNILDKPYFLSNVKQNSGVIFVRRLKGSIGLDWNALGIRLNVASIEFVGSKVNYKSFDKKDVEEIRIGYGYRKHLVFQLGKPTNRSFDMSNNFTVECRK